MKDVKFYIKTLEEIDLPTNSKYVLVEISFSDPKIKTRKEKIKGKYINSLFFSLLSSLGKNKFKKKFKKNFNYIMQNAYLKTIIDNKYKGNPPQLLRDRIYIPYELSKIEKIKHWFIESVIIKKMRVSNSLIKSVEITLKRIVKYNIEDIDDQKEEIIFLFYVFVLYKAVDLIKGLVLLNKHKQYRNQLILSRTLLDLNFRFLYLTKNKEDFIFDFMLKTGVNNLKIRLKEVFGDADDLFEKKFNDLDIKGNKFKNLELISKELKREKYYNYFYSLYSRFAHTNSLVQMSYLNDFPELKKIFQSDTSDHYKKNRQYYVLSNIYFYEIVIKTFDFMVEKNYMPSKDFLYKGFLKQLRKEKEKWEKINNDMEKECGFSY